MAWIETIDQANAQGELLAAYQAMAARPMPPAYRPPHGGPAGIIRAHSLDPRLLQATFSASGANAIGDALSWADRELIATSASRVNQCLY
jgi:alkylhydroperoxidase family enzyme